MKLAWASLIWIAFSTAASAQDGMTSYTPGAGENDPASRKARELECKGRDARRQALGNIIAELRAEIAQRSPGADVAAKKEELRATEAERRGIQPCDVSSAMESAAGPI